MASDEQSSDGTDRSGGLERFAIDRALTAAWATEFWIPADPEYGFVDYFEAAAARNLGLLRGFEELAADIDRRGIIPQSDSNQARLVTDGGHSAGGTYRFPELDGEDLWHLWQTYKYQGRDAAISWLRANVAVPLRYQFEDGFDEHDYYEAAFDRYVDPATDQGGDSS